MDKRVALISGATQRAAANDVDVVIEAVFEDEKLKQEIFAELKKVGKPGTILASNTSALDVDAIASVLECPENFVGMHFFSPANVMKLLEVVRAAKTSPEAVADRDGRWAQDRQGAGGFGQLRRLYRQSHGRQALGPGRSAAAARGAMPQDVDDALTAFGFPDGAAHHNDMSGLDIGYSIRKRRGTPFPIADAIVECGRFGQKTGAGLLPLRTAAIAPPAPIQTSRR